MPKIYESPDGGKTVYSREFGFLPGSLEDRLKPLMKHVDRIQEEQLWRDILAAAETNTALAEMIAQVKLLYQLSKDDENVSTQT